jgi:hypothetical protein
MPKIYYCRTCRHKIVDYHKRKYCGWKCYWVSLIGKPSPRKGKKVSPQTLQKLRVCYRKRAKKRGLHGNGYIYLYNPRHPRNINGGVPEQVIVMEKHIGRHLVPNEIVHHVNGIKTDNKLSNLQLMTDKEHRGYHSRKLHKRLKRLGLEIWLKLKRDKKTGRFLPKKHRIERGRNG